MIYSNVFTTFSQKFLDLEVKNEGVQDEAKIDKILQTVIKFSVRTRHPYFFNQLYGGVDEVALSGAWLTEALNTNQWVKNNYEMEAKGQNIQFSECVSI